ncbi:MAG: hypothetical protein ACFWTZ_04005 [Burkholderia sp.]|jgi:putative tricarboxylic transport membrane protein
MLTLGIPSNAVMALMIGAMMIHDITPGPQVMTNEPALFWGLIVSMWIGNLFLIILNLPMIRVWVQLLKVPYHWLYPAILCFCCIGVYSISNNVFDVWLTVFFGALGYVFNKLGCESARRSSSASFSGPCSRRTSAARCCSRVATSRCSSRARSPAAC